MWDHYIRIMIWFQTLYPARICFDRETKRFTPTHKRNLYFHWGWVHIMLSVVVAFFRVADYVRTPKHKLTMTFLDFMVEFFFFGAGVLIPAVFWTLRYRMDEYCWFLNEGYKLRNNGERKWDITLFMFYAMVNFSILGPFLIASLPFAFENTATHVVLRFFLPTGFMTNPNFVKCFTAAYMAFNMFSIIVHPNQMVLGMIVIFLDSAHYLKPAYMQGLPSGIQNIRRTSNRPNLRKACIVYNTTFLVWRGMLKFAVALLPALIFITVIVASVCVFATIKLHNELPLPILLGFHSIGIMVFTSLTYICDLIKIIESEVNEFSGFWRNESISRNGKQILASLIPIRINIGPFFAYESDTFLIILANIVDMTVTMMVA